MDTTPTPTDAAVTRLMHDEVAAGTLDLSVGEPDQTLPDALREVAMASLREGRTGYTPKLGLASLRRACAQSLPVPVDHADVAITVGGTEAVAVALMVALSPGDTLLIPDPAWPNYRVLAERLGLRVATYRQGAERAAFFDWDAIEAGLAAGARMVVVNSPSNPMGTTAGAGDLARLVQLAESHDAVILSDEAYESIVFDAAHAPSPLEAPHAADTVFVARTFSKTYSMTGLRAGFLASPSRFRHAVAATHGTVVGCAPRTAQEVALEALTSFPDRGLELSTAYRERFEATLGTLGEWTAASEVAGHGAFYVWLDGSATGRTADDLTAGILARGYRLSSGNAYTTSESHAVRLALTAPLEVLDGAFEAIRAELEA